MNTRRQAWPATFRITFFVLLAGWIALLIFPISNRPLRLASLGAPVAVLLTLLLAMVLSGWRAWFTRIFGVLLSLVLGVAAVLGGRLYTSPQQAHSQESLRARYIASLRGYLGTRYIWGGETRLGIDCSGLVRRAFVHALAAEGLAHGDRVLLKHAARLWWYDTTAQRLSEPSYPYTSPLGLVPNLNTVDPVRLLPGDLAVTRSGIHVMAYLGNNEWIEADPGEGRTVVLQAPGSNAWLSGPMQLMRWDFLAPLHSTTAH